MKLTLRATIYLILTILGLIFVVYSIKARDYILSTIAILFTALSTYNIFCGLKK